MGYIISSLARPGFLKEALLLIYPSLHFETSSKRRKEVVYSVYDFFII